MKIAYLSSFVIATAALAQEPAEVAEPILLIHDVADFVAAPAPAAGLGGVEHPEPVESVAAFLSAFIEPRLGEGEHIRGLKSGVLIVRAQPARQEWVKSTLANVRENRDRGLQLSAHLLEFSREQWGLVVEPLLGEAARTAKGSIVLPSGAKTDAWCGRAEQASEALAAPKLLVEQLSHAHIAVGSPVEYRKDYDRVQAADGTFEEQLVTDTLFDGFQIQAIGAILPSGISVKYELAFSALKRPIPVFETTLPSGREVEIDLPELSLTSFAQAVTMPDGAVSLTSVPRPGGNFLVILLRVHALALPSEQPNVAPPEIRQRRSR